MPMMNNETAARQVMQRLHLREVAVESHAMFTADMQMFAMADREQQQARMLTFRSELCAAYGLAPRAQDKPFAFSQGVAIIPVHGSLINRFGGSWGFITGYNFITAQTAAAGLDPDVTRIVYDHNSYGGEAAGCFETAAQIPKLANGKPTLAVVDSNCYSASFALACACDKIVVTPSGGVGSVGVVAMHVDMSKALEKWGFDVTLLHAGAHKIDGNQFEALPASVKASLQKSLDKSMTAFVSHVAKGRKMEDKAVRDTEARTYRADDALAIGFIDAVATAQDAVSAFLDESSGSNSQPEQEDEAMSANNATPTPDAAAQAAAQAQATQQAAADARTQERARVGGIMGCEEAKGRTELANHLAMNTEMTVEQAQATLKLAPVATAPAAAADAKGGAFAEAMDKSKNPNVGHDASAGTNGGSRDELTAAQRIKADAKAAGYGDDAL